MNYGTPPGTVLWIALPNDTIFSPSYPESRRGSLYCRTFEPCEVEREKMDDRGVVRGGCTSPGCGCLHYQPQGMGMRCTCRHPPGKHVRLIMTTHDSVRLQDGGDDVVLDSDLEQCLSLDDHHPTSVPRIANVSSVNAPVVTHAWAGPSQSLTAGSMLTAGEYQVVLLFASLCTILPIDSAATLWCYWWCY